MYCNNEFNALCANIAAHYSGPGYKCEWIEHGPCSHVFATLNELIAHLNIDHIDTFSNAENQCFWSGCDRSDTPFKARYKLTNHVRIHTGEKPFICNASLADKTVCGKSFSRAENLKIHKRCHTGEKPFVCFQPGCVKKFSNSSDRKKHMNVHKRGVLLCPVPECKRAYCHPSSLRKHLKTHGAKWEKCKLPERIGDTQNLPKQTSKQQFESSLNSSASSFTPDSPLNAIVQPLSITENWNIPLEIGLDVNSSTGIEFVDANYNFYNANHHYLHNWFPGPMNPTYFPIL